MSVWSEISRLLEKTPANLSERQAAKAIALSKQGWVVDKIALYFKVPTGSIKRVFRRANYTPVDKTDKQTFTNRKSIRNDDLQSSGNAMARLKKASAIMPLPELLRNIGMWFNGLSMGSSKRTPNMQAKINASLIKMCRAMRAAYPPKSTEPLYRAMLIRLSSIDIPNEKLLQLKRFVPGDKAVQSWTTSPAVAIKFYKNIHAITSRGKDNNYAWVVIQGDMSKYASISVQTAFQFNTDCLKNHDKLIELGLINPEEDFWSKPFNIKLNLQRLASAFIQSQKEVVCCTPLGKAIPCTIYQILRRGNQVDAAKGVTTLRQIKRMRDTSDKYLKAMKKLGKLR